MSNPSPLRYPGGKFKIAPLLKKIIKKANIGSCTYIEPFAGGAGVALELLLSDSVEKIIINDYDKAIYSFWRAVLCESKRFIDCIENVPLSIDEWNKQRNIYLNSTRYSFEYAFATFYLNRTNHSGILSSGPIGGRSQANPQWTLGVRFNRENLIKRIQKISEYKKQIICYNKDVISFIHNYLPKYSTNAFVYFDPPYYNNGKKLYKDFLEPEDHRNIAEQIFNNVKAQWIVSYDNVPQIRDIYNGYLSKTFSLSYSLANKGYGTEIMFFKDAVLCPSHQELLEANIHFATWE